MMREKSLEVRGGRFQYVENGDGIGIVAFSGNAGRLTVPGVIEEKPVTQVYKKAFFNCRFLRVLTLPETLQKIDSWAFAYCPQLERVELPWKPVELGKDLFIGSERLKEIELVRPGSDEGKQIAPLLAMAATKMEDPHLFSIEEAGSAEWLKKWDARMLVLLRMNDNEGYEKQVLAGEEDYERTDQVRYRNQMRRSKVRLAMMRLLHPCGLPEEIKEELENYLRAHTKGCRHEETWEVIRDEYSEDKACYELFLQLGCVNQDNFDAVLQDIGDEHTEMKAYLMRYKEEKLGYTDFFEGLSLDF